MSLSLGQIAALAGSELGRRRLQAAALGRLAPMLRPVGWLYRRTLARRVRIVAVTGSMGKTTTVRMLLAALGLPMTASLLSGANGIWSVPRRLFELAPGQRLAVVEIGIDRPGLMARQANMVAPDVAVVTSVASEHLELMRSLDTIQSEKSRLIAALRPGGVAVLNGDDARVRAMASLAPGKVWTYGLGPDNDVRAVDVRVDWPRGMRFTAIHKGEAAEVAIPMLGRHMILPALAALTVAAIEGVPWSAAAAALAGTQPMRARLEVVPVDGGVTLLVDHQKNSPEALAAALALAAEAPGRRILVVARVRQGSAESEAALRAAALLLVQAFDRVIAIGDGVEGLLAAATAAGFPPERVHRAAPGALDALRQLRGLVRPGDLVLLKSRIPWKLDRLVLGMQGRDVACDFAFCGLITLPCAECQRLGVAGTGRFG